MSLDTRGYDPQRLLPQSLEDRLVGWLARVGGFCLLAGVFVFWACLGSWSAADPSLTHITGAPARNLFGMPGAVISDLALQTLGLGFVLSLLAPLIWSLELLRTGVMKAGRHRLGFYPLAVLALAAAVSSYPVSVTWPVHHGYGGLLGDALVNFASGIFAYLNPSRAGLAASLLAHAAAAVTVARSLGLDTATLYASVLSTFERRETSDEFAPALTATTGRLQSWWRRRPKPAAAELPPNPYGAASELAVPPDYPPPHQWTADQNLPHLATYATATPPRVPKPQLSPGTSEFHPEADFTIVPVQASPGGDPEDRGQTFDFNTDAASSAIAARFAPGRHEGIAASQHATAEKAKSLLGGLRAPKAEPGWQRPSLNLLKRPSAAKPGPEFSQTVMRGNARLLEDVLNDFGIKGEIKDIRPGPVITLYELEPSRGTKSSRVIGLADDIARSMSVASVRAAIVPGRNAIGLELPNMRRETVLLRDLLESEAYKASDQALPVALGKSIGGEAIVADLARMPHLLVAGTTGSGKSVGINAFILSLLYRHSPAQCRMIMIDPKMLELSVYNGIPHLLTPVVTDSAKAVAALNWAVGEMEERYKRMAALSVRNIDVFNNRVRNAKKHGEVLARTVQTGFDRAGRAVFEKQKIDHEPLPHIVIVVDEFADLMIAAGKDVEAAVQRLAQMARAAGIHLIMATQRPSVDVVTGTIKANFPTRISFKVASKVDSRTILNEQGAEQLLGQGDMLYSSGAGQPTRVHGAFVSDEEVERVAEALRSQGPPNYIAGITDAPAAVEASSAAREPGGDDLYDRAVAIVLRDQKASTSYIQRRLGIGYNRAADLVERMEREGLISPANGVGKREILAPGGGVVDAA